MSELPLFPDDAPREVRPETLEPSARICVRCGRPSKTMTPSAGWRYRIGTGWLGPACAEKVSAALLAAAAAVDTAMAAR